MGTCRCWLTMWENCSLSVSLCFKCQVGWKPYLEFFLFSLAFPSAVPFRAEAQDQVSVTLGMNALDLANDDWSCRGPKCKGFERNQKKGERDRETPISLWLFQALRKILAHIFMSWKEKKKKTGTNARRVDLASDTVWMQFWCWPVEWPWPGK